MKKRENNLSYNLTALLPKVLIAVAVVVVFSVLLYIDVLIAVIFAAAVIVVLVVFLTRTLRKRLQAEGKIKKLCKKEKYRFERKRGFFQSFSWNTREQDFTVTTGRYVYYVHYLTVKHYRSRLTFENKESISYTIMPLKNIFTAALGTGEYKSSYTTDFPALGEEVNGKRAVRVVLVNPVCNEMYERDRDGGLVSTGNGMEKFGYTVMTGSGFIEAVQRNERNTKKETKKF